MPSPRMTDDEIWEFVSDAHTAIFTTLRRDGAPIALPVWFVAMDRRLYVRTRGRKLQRISADPRASILFETGRRWSELKAVHFSGHTEIVEPDSELHRRVRDELDQKYAEYRTAATAMPASTANHYATATSGVVRFTPDERILNWDNAKLGQ